MIPSWKIKREMKRLMQKLGYLPEIMSAVQAKRRYDENKASNITIINGQSPLTDELAIFLLYQPDGILASTLHTIDYFASQGIATLVVSNAPISKKDQEQLIPRAWKVMIRPNFGYDFGGYRDAILHVLDVVPCPKRLYVLNDSVWFPLQSDSDLVAEVRAQNSDLYGFVLNNRVRSSRRTHVQSYFFSFGPRVLVSPDFRAYWEKLFLTNNKDLVIRRCEIPMTRFFKRLGFSVSARHYYNHAAKALKKLDNKTLQSVIAYQTHVDTRSARRFRKFLQSPRLDAAWRAQVEADINAGHFDKYFLISHPAILIGQLHVPLLKKDRQDIYRLQRQELVSFGYDKDFAPCIKDEIKRWDSSTH
jgi:hypothetical protein